MNMAKVDHGLQPKMCNKKALKLVPIYEGPYKT